jgi:hypothetical protein
MAMLGNIITNDGILRGETGNQDVFPRFSDFSGPPFSVRGVAEHSSVMSMVPPFFLLQEVGAWLAFRRITGTSM